MKLKPLETNLPLATLALVKRLSGVNCAAVCNHFAVTLKTACSSVFLIVGDMRKMTSLLRLLGL